LLSDEKTPMKIEPLESRRLFDVTVTEGYPGFYEIQGTEGDDSIDVSVNMAEETMTVDGTTYNRVGYVVAYGYGGDDTIIITSVDGAGVIGASVVAGGGHDTVMLGLDGGIWGGRGDDQIFLLDSFRGEAYGEDGNDYMNITGLTSDARIDGGDGHDMIDCSGNQFGLVVFGGTGNDTILGSDFADELHGDEGNDVIEGGGGNDMIYVQGGGDDIVNGGQGEDIAYADWHDSADVEQVYFITA
jgi:Ca2+-binding RTX toxin-like protein